MLTGWRHERQVEDLRNHPAEMLTSLRNLLAGDGKISADPKRNGFYEVADRARTYYIHVSPVTGKILLLATWPNENAPTDETQGPGSDTRDVGLRGKSHPGLTGRLESDKEEADPSPTSANDAVGFGMADRRSCVVNC